MRGPRSITLKETALFFFPLLLNVQLMSVSHSVINAALARQEDAVRILAAFSVGMIVHLFFASPSYQNHTVTIAMVRGRRSLKGTIVFVLLVAAYVSIMLGLIAYTPLGDLLFSRLLGVSPEITAEARSVVGFLALLPFITGFRGLFQGLVIRARRTGLVSFATGVRIAALFGYLALGSRYFAGATLGAFALLSCVATETALMGLFAWRCRPPLDGGEEEKGTGEILRFAFPLAYSSCLQQTIPLLIAAIIGRFPDGALALAAFGIIRGFIFLLAGPMRNLQQAYLTLVRDHRDYRVLVGFFLRTGTAMGILMLLVAFPLNAAVLGRVMGLETELRLYLALPLAGCALFPLLYGLSNLLRGFFAGAHRTALLGRSTLYKMLSILAAWLLLTLVPLPLPGIAVAIVLLLAAELLEAGYLLSQRRRLFPEWGRGAGEDG
ncbi:hypothetical protein [Desulfuromonas sp.]|uniref:hypothetical protein n=1 Tax=Desulfuromonas sp. TaxID=892 RepID=UPI0025BC17F7|nr:hypothetical protein [Desulfuromonas sp.]